MPRMTLRKWLQTPNPHFIVPKDIAPSTQDTEAVQIDGWDSWDDLNMREINTLFGGILHTVYPFPDPPPPIQNAHRVIGVERDLEFAVTQWNVIIVNIALVTVAQGNPTLLWSIGSAAKSSKGRFPDWSAVMTNTNTNKRPSLIAGDSKMLTKDFPEEVDFSFGQSPDPKEAKCLKQVLDYASHLNTRYAYMLGPYDLVAIRLHSFPPDADSPDANPSAVNLPIRDSIARTRGMRPSSSARIPFSPTSSPPSQPPTTPRSSRNANPQTPSTVSHGSSYAESPSDRRLRKIANPEVRVVPWNASRDELSVSLVMFVLHYCAPVERECKDAYPPLSRDPVLRRALGLPNL